MLHAEVVVVPLAAMQATSSRVQAVALLVVGAQLLVNTRQSQRGIHKSVFPARRVL